MPTYDYACPDCGGFDALRPLALRNEPAPCPLCGAGSPRVWTSPARLAYLDSGTRRAIETNERAAHQPRSSSELADSRSGPGRLRHPAGCGCCAPGRRSATATAPNGAKSFPGKRPWMISH
jgi:putative FmdB family regulatory protein